MLKVDFINILPKSIFSYQIYSTKNFFTKTELYYQFTLCIFMTNFFWIKLTTYSIVFYFFLGNT